MLDANTHIYTYTNIKHTHAYIRRVDTHTHTAIFIRMCCTSVWVELDVLAWTADSSHNEESVERATYCETQSCLDCHKNDEGVTCVNFQQGPPVSGFAEINSVTNCKGCNMLCDITMDSDFRQYIATYFYLTICLLCARTWHSWGCQDAWVTYTYYVTDKIRTTQDTHPWLICPPLYTIYRTQRSDCALYLLDVIPQCADNALEGLTVCTTMCVL